MFIVFVLSHCISYSDIWIWMLLLQLYFIITLRFLSNINDKSFYSWISVQPVAFQVGRGISKQHHFALKHLKLCFRDPTETTFLFVVPLPLSWCYAFCILTLLESLTTLIISSTKFFHLYHTRLCQNVGKSRKFNAYFYNFQLFEFCYLRSFITLGEKNVGFWLWLIFQKSWVPLCVIRIVVETHKTKA